MNGLYSTNNLFENDHKWKERQRSLCWERERKKERKAEKFFSVARDRCNKLSTCEARNICCKEREKAKMHYLRLFPLPQQFVMSPPLPAAPSLETAIASISTSFPTHVCHAIWGFVVRGEFLWYAKIDYSKTCCHKLKEKAIKFPRGGRIQLIFNLIIWGGIEQQD